jgi:hypothetical protein
VAVIAESQVSHLREAVAAAALDTVPGPHTVIPNLLPADMYALLLETMPPPEGFDIADSVKRISIPNGRRSRRNDRVRRGCGFNGTSSTAP